MQVNYTIPDSVMAYFSHLPKEHQLAAASAYQALTLSPLTAAEMQKVGREVVAVAAQNFGE